MFNPEALEALSKGAQEKLNNQDNDDTTTEEPVVEDIYAKFRDNNDKSELYNTLDKMEDDFSGYQRLADMPDLSDAPPRLEDVEYNNENPNVPANEELFPGGPSMAQINIWKRQYPDCYVFVSEVCGEYFVCRTITRPEYKKVVSLYSLDQLQREEVICETCILFPYKITWEKINKLRGGIPSTLAAIIMDNSGFTNEYGVQIL